MSLCCRLFFGIFPPGWKSLGVLLVCVLMLTLITAPAPDAQLLVTVTPVSPGSCVLASGFASVTQSWSHILTSIPVTGSNILHHANLSLKCPGLIFSAFEKVSPRQREGAPQSLWAPAAPGGERGSTLGWDQSSSHSHTLQIMCMECVLTSSWVEEVQVIPGDNNQRLLWPILGVFQREK